jgi:hypothetical protein
MLIGHVINGYGPTEANVIDWERTMDVTDAALPELSYGFHKAVNIAGMKAATEVAGRVKPVNKHNAQIVMINEADILKWTTIIDLIRRKLRTRDFTIDITEAYTRTTLSTFSSRLLDEGNSKTYSKIRLSPHLQRVNATSFKLVIQLLNMH